MCGMYLEDQIERLIEAVCKLQKKIEEYNSSGMRLAHVDYHHYYTNESNCDELFTTAEIAKLLKCNKNYVGDLLKSGLLPYLQLGSRKVRRSALEKFMKDYEGWDLTDPYNPKLINK